MNVEEFFKDLKEKIPENIYNELIKKIKKYKDLTEEDLKRIKSEILRRLDFSTIQPGEAVGIIAAQSIGEPSTQMSLHRDEKIIIKRGENVEFIKIGDLVDGMIKRYGCKRINDSEVCDIDTDIEVLSLTDDEKLVWKRVSSFIRHKFDGYLLKIRTKTGREIVATPYHSFIIRKNNSILPIRGERLKIGDRIPIIRKIYLDNINHTNNIESKIELNEKLGYVVGVYIAKGFLKNGNVTISNSRREIINKVLECLKELKIKDLSKKEYEKELSLNSNILVEFLSYFGKNSDKRLPSFVLSAKEEFIIGLIRGIFDCNGKIYRNKIMLKLPSRELSEQMLFLLSRLGIYSGIKVAGNSYIIYISDRYVDTFKEKVKPYVNLNDIKSSGRDYIDRIPNFGDILKVAANKLGYKCSSINKYTRIQEIGRNTLLKHINRMKNLGYCEELNLLEKIANSDIIWDKIVEIERIPYKGYVYDLSVPESETFVTSQGVVTHNTMRTFHYAGVAELNVTLGLPRLIELVDARSEPSTPMMIIYLEPEYAKDREKAKTIAREIEYITIQDLTEKTEIDILESKIVIYLDVRELRRHEVSAEDVARRIKLKKSNVVPKEDRIEIYVEGATLKELRKIRDSVLDTYIKGIKGIKRVVIRKEGDEYVIYTQGTNLKEILKLEGIDWRRTRTNNIKEIEEVLGIEAARNALIQEIVNTLEEQGLEVDLRHISLLADMMTVDGEVKPIGRHGVAGEKVSTLARAAFEITVENLIRASIVGETDRLEGIIENIIVGKPIRLGTGIVELIAKREYFKI